MEYFISLKDANDRLLGFLRLRSPGQVLREEFTDSAAIIRELHVYGKAVAVGVDDGNAQHKGFGRKLMAEAERVAADNGKHKMLVISGIGVRNYYRKLGYELQGPYMVKMLI